MTQLVVTEVIYIKDSDHDVYFVNLYNATIIFYSIADEM